MTARRMVLFLAALVVFVGGAPTAGDAVSSGHGASGAAERSTPDGAPHREGPKLAALPLLHRASVATSGTGRRLGDGNAKVRMLGAVDANVAASGGSTGVDVDADARRLRASNTPCCVRGPPTAA